ncbi:MAG: TetR/AcrR family transcriptional regulator [Spirochaetales bacterium]|nr:TetR/AcrR family transcriptional regulator [Spirochaetales bacterium]
MSDQLFFDTVIDQFNRRGIKFTLDEVASAIRISKRTIYEKYGNKEQILMLTVDHFFSSLKKQEALIIKNEELDIIEKIRQTITLFPPLQIEFSHIDSIRVIYPDAYHEILHQFEINWENTFSLLRTAFSEGRLREFDLPTFRIIFLGIFQELMEYDEAGQREKLLQCLDLILDGYIINTNQ